MAFDDDIFDFDGDGEVSAEEELFAFEMLTEDDDESDYVELPGEYCIERLRKFCAEILRKITGRHST